MAVVMLAQRYVSSSLVAVVASFTAIWIMALDAPMWKYTFRSKCILAGILMGFAGVGLLYAEQLEMTVTVHDHSEYGILLLVTGCISWALGTLYTKYRSSDTEPANALQVPPGKCFCRHDVLDMYIGERGVLSYGIQYGPSIRLVVIGLSDTVRLADGLFRLRMAAEDPPDNGSGHPCLRESCGGCRYRWRAGREQITGIQLLGLVIILGSVMLVNKKKESMNKEMDIKDMVPVKTSERHVILDALRGFALLGICLANFPEFSLYTFQN